MNGPVLAIFSASSVATPEALEFLRLLAGIVACGGEAVLVEVANGFAAFAHEDVPDEVQRYLDALASSGVTPSRPSRAELRAALKGAGAVMRQGRHGRVGKPYVLVLTDSLLWDDSRTDDEIYFDVIGAGQVIRTRDSSP